MSSPSLMGMSSGRGHQSEECLRWARRVLLLGTGRGRGKGGALVLFLVFLAGQQSSSTSMGSSFISIVSIIEAHIQESPYLQNGPTNKYPSPFRSNNTLARHMMTFIQQMSEIDKRRERFRVEIQRQDREQYFKSRRQMLLQEEKEGEVMTEQEERLMQIARVTHIDDAILLPLRKEGLMEELTMAAQSRNQNQCRLLMVICGNALMDNLELEQREPIVGLLLHLYIDQGIMGGDAAQEIASGLTAFAHSLSFIHEDIASQGKTVLCELVLALIQWASPQPSSPEVDRVAAGVIGSIWNLLQDCKYQQQIEDHFRTNILFYNALLQLHPQLLRNHNNQCLILREGLLQIFQNLARGLILNLFPLVFEGQAFANFILEETILAQHTKNQKLALHILFNTLFDYEKVDCTTLMDCLTRPLPRKQAFFRKLLNDGPGALYRMKILKALVSQKKFYMPFEDCFQEHWRQVADLCVEMLRSEEPGSIRMGLQTLMVTHELRQDVSFARYLLSQGTTPLLEDLLWRIGEARHRGREVEGETLQIEEGLEYMLEKLQIE